MKYQNIFTQAVKRCLQTTGVSTVLTHDDDSLMFPLPLCELDKIQYRSVIKTKIFLLMGGIIIVSGRLTHTQTELFNVDADIHDAVCRGTLLQLADRCSAVDAQVETNGIMIVLIIQKTFVLMQIFASKLPASFAADIGRGGTGRYLEKRCRELIEPTGKLPANITGRFFLPVRFFVRQFFLPQVLGFQFSCHHHKPNLMRAMLCIFSHR